MTFEGIVYVVLVSCLVLAFAFGFINRSVQIWSAQREIKAEVMQAGGQDVDITLLAESREHGYIKFGVVYSDWTGQTQKRETSVSVDHFGNHQGNFVWNQSLDGTSQSDILTPEMSWR